jgi:hypothetical protein
MPTSIGTSTGATYAEDIILSVRDKIPDPVDHAGDDGTMFSLATMLRWLNNTMYEIAIRVPVVQDWFAFSSEAGQDVYTLPAEILTVEQLWYDGWPCWRSPELDALFVNKVTGRSYFFGHHSIGVNSALHVWPCAVRSGMTTTLTTTITATSTSLVLGSLTSLFKYGFVKIEDEIISYKTSDLATLTISNCRRGQCGTVAAAHNATATVQELNITFKGSRLPKQITGINDLVEIPKGLHGIINLGMVADAREAEQEFQEARGLRQEFNQALDKLAATYSQTKGIKQGLQIRREPPGPYLYSGRVYIP